MRCIHCGEEIPRKAKKCPGCGVVISNEKAKQKKLKKKKLILAIVIAVVVGLVSFLGMYHLIKIKTIDKYTQLAEEALAEEDYEEAIECYLKILRPFRNVPEVQKAFAETLVIAYEKDDMFKYERESGKSYKVTSRYGQYLGDYKLILYNGVDEVDERLGNK